MARASDFDDKKHDVMKQIAGTSGVQVPTVRELAERFGVAPATMHSWLRKLGPKGEELVAWETGRHRSLRLTRKGSRALSSLAKRSA